MALWRPPDEEQVVAETSLKASQRLHTDAGVERAHFAADNNLAVISGEPKGGDSYRPAAGADAGAARESEDIVRLVTDNLSAAICYVDGDERYGFANRTHEEWFGFSPEGTVGKTVREVLGDDAYGTVAAHIRSALRGQDVVFDVSLACRSGDTRGVRGHYVPRWDESRRRVKGFVALFSDISRVERTEAPESERLFELAHSARLSLIGEMAGELTHELAQPLAAISNYSSAAAVLLQQGRTDEVRDITQKLALHARRALAIVQSLRRFLRKERTDSEPIDMHELVQEVLRLIQWEAASRGVPVRFETALSLPTVRGDRTLIEQVVLNLLRNALDAVGDRPAKQAPIVVTVGLTEAAVEITVQDRGPGLAPEAKAHLFEPFFTTKRDGLGIGLFICRRIIESHGGRLWAEDNANAPGTTFRFTLPGA